METIHAMHGYTLMMSGFSSCKCREALVFIFILIYYRNRGLKIYQSSLDDLDMIFLYQVKLFFLHQSIEDMFILVTKDHDPLLYIFSCWLRSDGQFLLLITQGHKKQGRSCQKKNG